LGLHARVGVDGIVGWLDDVAAPRRFLLTGADGDPVEELDPALASGGTHWAGSVCRAAPGKRLPECESDLVGVDKHTARKQRRQRSTKVDLPAPLGPATRSSRFTAWLGR
jgi:hypothetical protein